MNTNLNQNSVLVMEKLDNEVNTLLDALVMIVGDKYETAIKKLLSENSKIDFISLTENKICSYGFTQAAAKKVLGAIHFALKLSKVANEKRFKIRSPEDAYEYFKYLENYPQEHFVMVGLNTMNEVLFRKTLAIGTLNGALIHPRDMIREAIAKSACRIVVAHQHPSGDTKPSSQDVEVTEKLSVACEIVGVELIDHLIIGAGGFLSLKSKGYF